MAGPRPANPLEAEEPSTLPWVQQSDCHGLSPHAPASPNRGPKVCRTRPGQGRRHPSDHLLTQRGLRKAPASLLSPQRPPLSHSGHFCWHSTAGAGGAGGALPTKLMRGFRAKGSSSGRTVKRRGGMSAGKRHGGDKSQRWRRAPAEEALWNKRKGQKGKAKFSITSSRKLPQISPRGQPSRHARQENEQYNQRCPHACLAAACGPWSRALCHLSLPTSRPGAGKASRGHRVTPVSEGPGESGVETAGPRCPLIAFG